jgi:NADPH:quinone reductase-like Zn-dependent oxidoreductase
VLVRIRLRPVNPSDIFTIAGSYGGFKPKSLPAVPGLEGMGVVEDKGKDASKFEIGQRVVGVPWPAEVGEGTWQQYVAVDESNLLAVKDNVSDEAAAQYLINPVTAYGFLDTLQIPKGKYLLQNAANSVLGKELIAMAKDRGVKTLNMVRRKEAADDVLAIGGDAVINVSEPGLDIPKKIRELTGGEGAWDAVNPIGGEINAEIMKGLRNHGRDLIFSLLKGPNAAVPMGDLHFRDLVCKGFWLNNYLSELDQKERERVLNDVMDLMDRGIVVPPPPSKKFPLEQAIEAVEAYHQYSGKGGKVMLEG